MSAIYVSSAPSGFLCLGFLRSGLGSITRAEGTGPSRSRAIARTSFVVSNFFAFATVTSGERLDGFSRTPYNGNVTVRRPNA